MTVPFAWTQFSIGCIRFGYIAEGTWNDIKTLCTKTRRFQNIQQRKWQKKRDTIITAARCKSIATFALRVLKNEIAPEAQCQYVTDIWLWSVLSYVFQIKVSYNIHCTTHIWQMWRIYDYVWHMYDHVWHIRDHVRHICDHVWHIRDQRDVYTTSVWGI